MTSCQKELECLNLDGRYYVPEYEDYTGDKLEDPGIAGRVEEAFGNDQRPQRAVELMMNHA
jgi:hypothetical protein